MESISNYSYAELIAMKNRHKDGVKSCYIFTYKEVCAEIERRELGWYYKNALTGITQ